jgi:glyoxylase-like metal-dependent hydrolase (beta-lactamase superfamily II)/ferredoxin
MATLSRRLPANAPGDLFVDSSCIDCGACMWIAPATFDEHAGQSRVHAQPADDEQTALAAAALLSCPTASIGVAHDEREVRDAGAPASRASALRSQVQRQAPLFPRPFAPQVLHCGYHSEATFGAASWLLLRPDGNVLVDVPRFTAPLVARIAALGGVRWLFLTHRDDVAGHEKFAERFGCERILHAADVDESTRDVERAIDGLAPVELAADLVVVPTPGHTRGSACLWHRAPPGDASGPTPAASHLFTGDHLAWDEERDEPYGFRDACWHSWPRVIESTRRLVGLEFEWLLPGHGAPGRAPAKEMAARMARAVAWMESRR